MFKESQEGKTHSFNDGCGEPAHNQPIEEKWKERLNSLLFKNLDIESENARPMSIKLSDELESFIENLLEQERQRMSEEIESVGYNSVGIGCGIEDNNITNRYESAEYGYNEAKREILDLIHPGVEEIPQMKGTLEALDKLAIINK